MLSFLRSNLGSVPMFMRATYCSPVPSPIDQNSTFPPAIYSSPFLLGIWNLKGRRHWSVFLSIQPLIQNQHCQQYTEPLIPWSAEFPALPISKSLLTSHIIYRPKNGTEITCYVRLFIYNFTWTIESTTKLNNISMSKYQFNISIEVLKMTLLFACISCMVTNILLRSSSLLNKITISDTCSTTN